METKDENTMWPQDEKGPTDYQIFAPAEPTVLRIIPDLAEEIGLNESVLLLQIAFWIRNARENGNRLVRDGRYCTYQSVRKIQRKALKWCSISTIWRAIHRLEKLKLIYVGEYNKNDYDRTNWFALNPEGFRFLKSVRLEAEEIVETAPNETGCSTVKRGVFHSETGCSTVKQGAFHSETTIPETTIPETTTEITTETTTNIPPAAEMKQPEEKTQIETATNGGTPLKEEVSWEDLEPAVEALGLEEPAGDEKIPYALPLNPAAIAASHEPPGGLEDLARDLCFLVGVPFERKWQKKARHAARELLELCGGDVVGVQKALLEYKRDEKNARWARDVAPGPHAIIEGIAKKWEQMRRAPQTTEDRKRRYLGTKYADYILY